MEKSVNNQKNENKLIGFIVKKAFFLVTFFIMILVLVLVSIQYVSFRYTNVEFVVRSNVEVQRLGDYYSGIKGTIGDAEVYVIGTKNPDEPSVLLLGGIHPNEPAGQIASVLVLEQIDVTRGTVYVITEANKSAYTHSHPQEATPMYYSITDTVWGGARTFKYGSRATSAVDQWPIPDVYVHQATGQRLSGTDTRNINRSFPGNKNGNYTEKVAQAIVNLINQNNITLVLDLHEASPEYGTNNALIYHQKDEFLGINGIMKNMFDELNDFAPIKFELSPVNLRGLTHREIGDNTDAIPFLAEASNTTQGRIRDTITEENIVTGEDKYYQKATSLGILEVDHSNSVSLHERVARHVETFRILIYAYNEFTEFISANPDKAMYQKGEFIVDFHKMSYERIIHLGIGYYLRNPENPDLEYWPSDFS